MNNRELIRRAAKRFEAAGISDPAVDASLLLSHLTGRPALELRLDIDHEADETTLEAFKGLCLRRMRREPLQYILGTQPFCGYTFEVDSRVLIPRPETELLAEMAVEALQGRLEDAPTALDLCCGSGCLAVTMALKVPRAQVHAADVSRDALEVAALNAARLGAEVTLHEGDLLQAVEGLLFDVIVSNPPYIPREECRKLQEEVRREPLLALDGGEDGLDFYRRIAHDAPRFLRAGGMLLLECGFGEARAVAALLGQCGFEDMAIHRDWNDVERMVTARYGKRVG